MLNAVQAETVTLQGFDFPSTSLAPLSPSFVTLFSPLCCLSSFRRSNHRSRTVRTNGQAQEVRWNRMLSEQLGLGLRSSPPRISSSSLSLAPSVSAVELVELNERTLEQRSLKRSESSSATPHSPSSSHRYLLVNPFQQAQYLPFNPGYTPIVLSRRSTPYPLPFSRFHLTCLTPSLASILSPTASKQYVRHR
jgi:hypothetical protein